VVIDIVLPAVLGLVLVRKSSVETCGVNCKFIFNRIHFDYFDIPAGQKLAIRPFLSIFEGRGGYGHTGNKLEGLGFAIVVGHDCYRDANHLCGEW
jgi:hypothetical protein